jgi:hypothetical protein
LVPVKPIVSRNASSSVTRGSSIRLYCLPLMRKFTSCAGTIGGCSVAEELAGMADGCEREKGATIDETAATADCMKPRRDRECASPPDASAALHFSAEE